MSVKYQACTFDYFERFTAYHWMDVIRDDGDVNRHIRFQQTGTGIDHFDLITWPGKLCVTGDHGTFVFARTRDMFEFFRSDQRGRINPDYWSEKVIAEDRDGVRRYDPDLFRLNIEDWLNDFIGDRPLRDRKGRFASVPRLRRDVEWDVLMCADDGEQRAVSAAMDFKWDGCDVFPDFWEVNNKAYTHAFLWNLYAISWGVQQYDSLPTVRSAQDGAVAA